MTKVESFTEGQQETINPGEELNSEFERLDKWISDWGVPPEVISEVFFPIIFGVCPQFLEDAKRRAVVNWNVRQKTTTLLESLPLEYHMWQKDDEREGLIDAAKIGLFDEAFEALKKKYHDAVGAKHPNGRIGFGTYTEVGSKS